MHRQVYEFPIRFMFMNLSLHFCLVSLTFDLQGKQYFPLVYNFTTPWMTHFTFIFCLHRGTIAPVCLFKRLCEENSASNYHLIFLQSSNIMSEDNLLVITENSSTSWDLTYNPLLEFHLRKYAHEHWNSFNWPGNAFRVFIT
jgi:hypothetical protein